MFKDLLKKSFCFDLINLDAVTFLNSNCHPLKIAAGTRRDFFITNSAAEAISSATAISVILKDFPYMSFSPI